jgi:hypothetical protein
VPGRVALKPGFVCTLRLADGCNSSARGPQGLTGLIQKHPTQWLL